MVLNTCLVILERSEKAVGNSIIEKYGKEWRIRAKDTRFKYSDLCTQTCPYRLARLGTSRPKAKRLIAFSRRYAPKNTIRLPPYAGEADTKEESNQVLYLYTHLCVSLAGFFAKSHMMFFLLSLFLFCPPLKNDGRNELRFQRIFHLLC